MKIYSQQIRKLSMHSTGQPQILIAGDVCPTAVQGDDLVTRLGLSESPEWFLWTLDAALPSATPRQGVTCMPFSAKDLRHLSVGRSNLAITASNHFTDFGDSGAERTISALDQHGFQHVGAGMSIEQASQNAFLDLAEGRAAVLAYAEIAPRVGAVAASEHHAGIRPFDVENCIKDIAAARNEADWVWVILHWGEEFVRFPDPVQRQSARRLIDAGASLVIAAHTHVPLGFETRDSGTIFYGLGNFIFPPYREARGYHYQWHKSARDGVVVAGTFVAGTWTWTPHEIRLSPTGIPRAQRHGHCPDYQYELPENADEYARLFPHLRMSERRKFAVQRLIAMSWQERSFRFRQVLGKVTGRSR